MISSDNCGKHKTVSIEQYHARFHMSLSYYSVIQKKAEFQSTPAVDNEKKSFQFNATYFIIKLFTLNQVQP